MKRPIESEFIDNDRKIKKERTSSVDEGNIKKYYDDNDNDDDANENEKDTKIEISTDLLTRKCPYLDTVNRQKLDFDQLKVCSVTLSNINVYACLVCGKYFQGKSKATPAYTHSVQMGHFVFINLQDTRTYCLPDDYEILDVALNDVKKCLSPHFKKTEIEELNSNTALARDVYGVSYLPGFVGLNNLQCTDYINVILHALTHVSPLRNYFLQNPIPCLLPCPSSSSSSSTSNSNGHKHSQLDATTIKPLISNSVLQEKYPLLKAFATMTKKLWSRDNFKSVISPAEFAHALNLHSHGRFSVTRRVEVSELFCYLLNELHKNIVSIQKIEYSHSSSSSSSSSSHSKKLTSGSATKSSIIYDTFQGEMEIRTKKLTISTASTGTGGRGGQQSHIENSNIMNTASDSGIKTQKSPFMMLSLDIPPSPLFKDSQGAAVIPQIPLFELLKKYDGETWIDKISGGGGTSDESGPVRKQYVIRKLPRYLVFHLKRFSSDGFGFTEEKNSTIVTFPVKNLEMKNYYQPITAGATNNTTSEQPSNEITKYDLIANICHDTLTAQSVTSGLTTNASTRSSAQSSNTSSTAAAASTDKTSSSASASMMAQNINTALSNGSYRIHLATKVSIHTSIHTFIYSVIFILFYI